MSNVLDTIQLSGSSYDLKDKNAANVSAVTQAEYDNLPTSAKTSNTLFVITDAQAGDLTQYWTSAQTQSAITQATSGKVDTTTFNTYSGNVETALSGKQETLSAGTGIDITDNVISVTGGGGGGKAVSGGTNISITTGETADTINCTLPISAGTGWHSIKIGSGSQAGGNSSVAEGYVTYANGDEGAHAEGYTTYANGKSSHAEGRNVQANGNNSHAEGISTNASGHNSHAEGVATQAIGRFSHTEGYYTIANWDAEHASGQYNVSSSGSSTFGDSGNTLFSVGNGTSTSARHNAFEIRQNGDIYLSSGGTDIKLQDYLGGGGSSINVVQTTGSSTTDVMSQAAVTNIIGDIETLLSNI